MSAATPLNLSEDVSLHIDICRIIAMNNMYRPPGPASAFFSELQDIVTYMAALPHHLVLMGDLILHIESSTWDVRQLSGILESFDLNQQVSFPIRFPDHTL